MNEPNEPKATEQIITVPAAALSTVSNSLKNEIASFPGHI